MNTPLSSSQTRLRALDSRRTRGDSHIILTIFEGLMGLGIVSALCAIAGFLDDVGDSVVLGITGVLIIGTGAALRAKLIRRRRPTASAVLSGLAATWVALVLVGTAVYLITGTISRIDDALVEAAAGFSTTALTTLDPSELSVPMTLWRASTQWVGGLVGILVGVVALPMALQGKRLTPTEWGGADDFAPSRSARRRQVLAIYVSLTALIGIAFAATGMGAKHSVVHAPDHNIDRRILIGARLLRKLRSRPRSRSHRGHDCCRSRLLHYLVGDQGSSQCALAEPGASPVWGNIAVGNTSGLVGRRWTVMERLTVHDCVLGQHNRLRSS